MNPLKLSSQGAIISYSGMSSLNFFSPGKILSSSILYTVVCSVLMLSGCNSTTYVSLDLSVPPEETCTLNINASLTVKSFDGKEVKWEPGWGATWVSVKIPAGSHMFVLDYHESGMKNAIPAYALKNYLASAHDISFNYPDFVAGHVYDMVAKKKYSYEYTKRVGDAEVSLASIELPGSSFTREISIMDITKEGRPSFKIGGPGR